MVLICKYPFITIFISPRSGFFIITSLLALITESLMETMCQHVGRDGSMLQYRQGQSPFKSWYRIVCKIPLLARRTQPAGQARRATIGYLVYKVSYCTAIKRAVLLLSLAVHRLASPSRKGEIGRVCLSHQWTTEVRSKEWGALLSTQISISGDDGERFFWFL